MPPALVAELILIGFKIWLIILEDMPKEERQKAWKRWFAFLDAIEANLPKLPEPPA